MSREPEHDEPEDEVQTAMSAGKRLTDRFEKRFTDRFTKCGDDNDAECEAERQSP